MKVLSYTDSGYARWRASMDRQAVPTTQTRKTVENILSDVQRHGDSALRRLTKKFDNITLRQLALPKRRLKISSEIIRALKYSHANILQFSSAQMPKSWRRKNRENAIVGEEFQPFQRVGIYVPGGTAPLVSTALMTVTLAAAAGCPEIVVVTPPPVNETLEYAIRMAGATEIYQIGGAQAIAALAFGTRTIRKVQKIVGPGNRFVNEAKRQVVGYVAIDQLPGPSEAMVIADDSANAIWIAADLLAQAEHGFDSQAILLTPSKKLRDQVECELGKQLQTLSRRNILERSLNAGVILVQIRNMEEAIEIANDYAPEHLSLQIQQPQRWLKRIQTAGAVFLGKFSPIVAGDFVAGPSHTLPTGGAGKSFGGLTIDQFFRRMSVMEYNLQALKKVMPIIETFAQVECLDAHGRSAKIRLKIN